MKNLLIPVTAIALSFSAPTFAKKDKDDQHPGRYNSNKQSYEDSLRGLDRAEQRHELKRLKKKYKKQKKADSDSGDSGDSGDDRYDDDYRTERRMRVKDSHRESRDYRYNDAQRPIESGINRGADQAKQKIDEIHRRTIESIDKQTSEINNKRPISSENPQANPWWWPF